MHSLLFDLLLVENDFDLLVSDSIQTISQTFISLNFGNAGVWGSQSRTQDWNFFKSKSNYFVFPAGVWLEQSHPLLHQDRGLWQLLLSPEQRQAGHGAGQHHQRSARTWRSSEGLLQNFINDILTWYEISRSYDIKTTSDLDWLEQWSLVISVIIYDWFLFHNVIPSWNKSRKPFDQKRSGEQFLISRPVRLC